MEPYINPPAALARERRREEERTQKRRTTPESPQRDVLQFLLDHAPLAPWEHDVLAIVRDEAYYFAPQGMTKVLNEGWASYWHSTIMTRRALRDSEVVDFADQHAGTMAMQPGRFNPYKVGIELFREIEDRWNKGKFGREYEDCDDLRARRDWDRKLGLGRQKIFEVRKVYNDVMFVDAFLDEEFCERLKLYTYGFDPRSGQYVVTDRDWRKVKQRLLFSLTNLGQPIVQVTDANHANRGELYLQHRYEGVPLDVDKAKDTLQNLHRLWRRPVHLETADEDQARLLSFDGTDHKWVRL
jgi:stage V sporulation protein R